MLLPHYGDHLSDLTLLQLCHPLLFLILFYSLIFVNCWEENCACCDIRLVVMLKWNCNVSMCDCDIAVSGNGGSSDVLRRTFIWTISDWAVAEHTRHLSFHQHTSLLSCAHTKPHSEKSHRVPASSLTVWELSTCVCFARGLSIMWVSVSDTISGEIKKTKRERKWASKKERKSGHWLFHLWLWKFYP